MTSLRTKGMTLAAIAGAAIGGSAIANAASSGTTSTPAAASSSTAAPPAQRDPSLGGHQANGKTETLLTGDTASKVEAAAKAAVPGGTVERVENDVDTGSPYEAHVKKADGSEVVVYVDSNFKVTSTAAFGGHGGRGPGGPSGAGAPSA